MDERNIVVIYSRDKTTYEDGVSTYSGEEEIIDTHKIVEPKPLISETIFFTYQKDSDISSISGIYNARYAQNERMNRILHGDSDL